MLIRICKGIVVFLFFMAVVLGLSWMIFQMNHRAVLSGELKFSTVSNDIEIKRDNFGVPHIHAKNIEDLDTEAEDHAADEWRYGMIHFYRPMAREEDVVFGNGQEILDDLDSDGKSVGRYHVLSMN